MILELIITQKDKVLLEKMFENRYGNGSKG